MLKKKSPASGTFLFAGDRILIILMQYCRICMVLTDIKMCAISGDQLDHGDKTAPSLVGTPRPAGDSEIFQSNQAL